MEKLIFVYNADSGMGNALLDSAKKYFSTEKYKCSLCSVSYGAIGAKKEWKEFLKKIPLEKEFLHKDEFLKKYSPKEQSFPGIYILESGKTRLIEDFRKLKNNDSVEKLKQIVIDSLENKGIKI